MSSDPPDVPEPPTLVDPELLAELGRKRAEMEQLLNSPAIQAARDDLQRLIDSPLDAAIKALGESLPRLDKKQFELPQNSLADLPQPADERAVAVLHQVHAELQGMAAILNESRQQTAAMMQVTQANLTAVQAVIGELRETRTSAGRSNTALFWLTVALFAAAVVAAIAVVPEFIKQVIQGWSWLTAHI